MAKWDLSKLPEGRKPLPDEWFAERAQMQDRIKELEKQLRWVLYERDATFKSMLNRAETAEAKLAKALANRVAIMRLEAALKNIRDVAEISEGTQWYAMIADKALTGGKNE